MTRGTITIAHDGQSATVDATTFMAAAGSEPPYPGFTGYAPAGPIERVAHREHHRRRRGGRKAERPGLAVLLATDDVSTDLLRQALTDRFEKRLDRPDDLLPVARWPGVP